MFTMAVSEGYLDVNPFHDVKTPRVPLPDRVRAPPRLFQGREEVPRRRPGRLGEPYLADERDHVQGQRALVVVLRVALHAVMPKEDGLVLADGARGTDDGAHLAGRPAGELIDVLLLGLGDFERLLVGVVGARRLVATVRALVKPL
jgi:hypothetical protein